MVYAILLHIVPVHFGSCVDIRAFISHSVLCIFFVGLGVGDHTLGS